MNMLVSSSFEGEVYLNKPLSHHDKRFIDRTVLTGLLQGEVCVKTAKRRRELVEWLLDQMILRNRAWRVC